MEKIVLLCAVIILPILLAIMIATFTLLFTTARYMMEELHQLDDRDKED